MDKVHIATRWFYRPKNLRWHDSWAWDPRSRVQADWDATYPACPAVPLAAHGGGRKKEQVARQAPEMEMEMGISHGMLVPFKGLQGVPQNGCFKRRNPMKMDG